MRHVHFDVTDSTNAQARSLAGEHPGETLLVTAAEQTAGRGRQGRAWLGPHGGAWMSVVWPLRKSPPAYIGASLAAAVAVLRALGEVVGQKADAFTVKWPNDILLGGKKIAGVLCEQCQGGAPTVGYLVIGIGVNVDFDPALLGNDLRQPATSLRAAQSAVPTVEDVIGAVSRRLVEVMAVFEDEGLAESILPELRSRLANVGTMQTVGAAGRTTTGRVLGIDAAGRLLLECEGGVVACESGELLADAAKTER